MKKEAIMEQKRRPLPEALGLKELNGITRGVHRTGVAQSAWRLGAGRLRNRGLISGRMERYLFGVLHSN